MKTLIYISLVFLSTSLYAQDVSHSDSLDIKSKVTKLVYAIENQDFEVLQRISAPTLYCSPYTVLTENGFSRSELTHKEFFDYTTKSTRILSLLNKIKSQNEKWLLSNYPTVELIYNIHNEQLQLSEQENGNFILRFSLYLDTYLFSGLQTAP